MFAVVLVSVTWVGLLIDMMGDISLDPVVRRGQIIVCTERCLEGEAK